jgi:hypothetical protein
MGTKRTSPICLSGKSEIEVNNIENRPRTDPLLELLEPFDVSSVKLKPAQVKKAWVDPDFLKGLQG